MFYFPFPSFWLNKPDAIIMIINAEIYSFAPSVAGSKNNSSDKFEIANPNKTTANFLMKFDGICKHNTSKIDLSIMCVSESPT